MLKWREAYSCYSASLASGAIQLSVMWNSTAPKGSPRGYVVSVNSRKLKTLAPDATTGQKAAVRLARKILAEALEELREEP